MNEKVPLDETEARHDDIDVAIENAKQLGRDNDAYSVIYGYQKDGKFYAIKDPYICRDMKEHELAAELVKMKYRAYTIYAIYDRQFNENLDIQTSAATKVELDDNSALISSEDHRINVESDDGANIQVNDDGSVEVRKSAEAPFDDEEHQEVEPIPAPEDDELSEEEPVEDEEAEEESPKDEMFGSYRSRKELSEALKKLKEQKIPYIIRRSTNENYRYDVLKEDAALTTIDEPEVIDPKKAERSEVAPGNLSDTEVEVLNKLFDISKDISDNIQKYYGIQADPRLIVADMVQDLRLVSGNLKPKDLPDTPINQVTKEMYRDYNSFYDFVDKIETLITGEEHHTTPERKLQQAIQMLDSDNFSPEAIEKGIASDRFLKQVRRGAIPFIPQDQVKIIESYLKECDNNKPSCTEPDCDKEAEKPEDVQIGNKEKNKEILNETPADYDKEETVEMDIGRFDEDINNYFDESYEDTVLYTTTKGYIDPQGNILLEGFLKSEEAQTKIKFTLCPSKRMNEGVEETIYHVTNNLSEEEFEFTF